jgi:hypothetical protein
MLRLEEKMYQEISNNISYGKNRYSRWLDAARQAQPNLSPIMESNIIRSLRSMEDEMSRTFGADVVSKYITEAATTPGNIDAFIHYGFDIVTAMMPANPIEEFATIQAIDKRVGEIFYMDIVKGSTKGSVHTAGENYMASQTGPNTNENYSNEQVPIEELGEGDGSTLSFLNIQLGWYPVKAYNSSIPLYTGCAITYMVGSVEYSVTDNGTNSFIDATNLASGTINYTTGIVDLVFKAGHAPDLGTTIVATYWQDSARDDVNQNPEVYLKLTSAFVYAQRRFLNTRWMIDSAIMLNKEHGKDMEKELTEKVLSGVMNESAAEVANRIYGDATANSGSVTTFSTTPPSTTIPYVTHRQEILGTIGNMSTDIESATQKVTANFIIAGANMVKLLKGLPRDIYDPVKYTDKVPTGMHVIGVLDNQWKVIQNFNYTASKFLVGAKGPDWLTTGCVWAPFIPLMTTPINWTLKGDQWRSLLQWAGIKTVNGLFYNKGAIS